jgi:hypothetical protein
MEFEMKKEVQCTKVRDFELWRSIYKRRRTSGGLNEITPKFFLEVLVFFVFILLRVVSSLGGTLTIFDNLKRHCHN